MSVILFILALAILILSHEFGHFLFAKISGTKVEEFGLGFPPRLFGKKFGETLYSVNAIPFGGFVKVSGENSTDKSPGSFGSRPIYMRAGILVAGVFFNLLLAWLLISFVYIIGAPTGVGENVSNSHVTVLEVQQGTPAEAVGFLPGDRLERFSFGQEVLEVKSVKEVQDFISAHKGSEMRVEYFRGNERIAVLVTPSLSPREGVGALGIAMDSIGIVSLPIHKAFWEGLKDTGFLVVTIVKMFGALISDIFKGGSMVSQIRGPIGIVGMTGMASQLGFVYVIQFIAILSVNLAVINIMPFPALDGGRLLFLAIEAVKRSPVNEKVMAVANNTGFALLIILMLLVTYKDIVRLVSS